MSRDLPSAKAIPDALPVLPSTAMRMLRLDRSSEHYVDRVLQLLELDPPMAAKVLSASNSAASGPVCPVTTLRAALSRLGTRRVGSLVIMLGVAEVFLPGTDAQCRMWRHSIEVALGARFLVARTPQAKLDPEEAFLAGLLHDIGRFVMFSRSPDELARIEERGWNSAGTLLASEREISGTDHAAVGALACRHWGLPGETVEMIARHHEPRKRLGSTATPRVCEAVTAVQIADILSLLLTFNGPFRTSDAPRRASALRAVRDAYQHAGSWLTPELLAETSALMENRAPVAMAELGL